MSPDEIRAIEKLFSSVKTDIDQRFEAFTSDFKEFKKEIKDHIEKANGAHTDIELLKKDVSQLQKENDKNTEQHKEFYINFKKLDRFVYKLSGGIAIAGIVISAAWKILGKIT